MAEPGQIFSDDDVVRSVREGNTRDFDILIDRYKNRVINFIHKMIYDYDEAQSLSQDVFLKVFETIRRYKTQDNFQAFLFTIAKNITLNHIKKHKRVVFFSHFFPRDQDEENRAIEDTLLQDAEKETPHALLEKKQAEAILTAALKTLNENQRLALILKVYLEFSYNRISEITGWSVPKIETLISRAKSNLKHHIRGLTKEFSKKNAS